MPKEKLKYSMLIEYDDEGQCYLVTLPEWIGYTNGRYITHGDTYADAVKMGQECLESLVEVARNEGDAIPEPAIAKSIDTQLPSLEERVEALEKEVTLEQFYKGLALLGYRLTLGTKKLSTFTIRTETDFHRATRLITALIDIVGDDESHPLADVLDCVSEQVKAYDDEHHIIKDAQGESND